MLVEIIKDIRWFLFIILISVMASWNAFLLLLKGSCQDSVDEQACKVPRDVTSMIRAMYNMVNTLLFGDGDQDSLKFTDHYGIVVAIYIFSMIGIPIIMLNMLVAIMTDSYERIKVRFVSLISLTCVVCSFACSILNAILDASTGTLQARVHNDESPDYSGDRYMFPLKIDSFKLWEKVDASLQEIELFMSDDEKRDPDNFPKYCLANGLSVCCLPPHLCESRFLHVIVRKDEAPKCVY
jgi:hypothetical protein